MQSTTEGSAVPTDSAAQTTETDRDLRDLYDQPFAGIQRSQRLDLRAVTTQQATVLADLAFALLQKRRGKIGALATLLSGRINELDPEEFRQTLATLVKCASGSSLDVIGGLFDKRREIDIRETGQYTETDAFFSSWSSQMILRADATINSHRSNRIVPSGQSRMPLDAKTTDFVGIG